MRDPGLQSPPPPARWRRSLRPIGRVLRSLFHTRRHLLLACELDAVPPSRRARVEVAFRAALPAEASALVSDPAHEISEEGRRVHEQLLAEGARCTLGLVGGRVVYHGWSAAGRWRIAGGASMDLPPGTAIIFRCFTVRSERGKGIYGAALGWELARLAREGFHRALINVEMGNLISRRAIASAGFRQMGTYRVTCVAGVLRASLPESLRSRIAADSSRRPVPARAEGAGPR